MSYQPIKFPASASIARWCSPSLLWAVPRWVGHGVLEACPSFTLAHNTAENNGDDEVISSCKSGARLSNYLKTWFDRLTTNG